MWYAAGLLNSLGTWGGVCFHCLWRVVVVIYKYKSLLSTITHTHIHTHTRWWARGTSDLRFRSQNQLHTMTQGPEVKGEQVSKGVSGEKEHFYRGAESLPSVEIHLRLLTLKELFIHNLHIFLFFFKCVKTRNVDENVSESSVIYSIKKKTKLVRFVRSFPVVSEDRCVPWTLKCFGRHEKLGYGWVNREWRKLVKNLKFRVCTRASGKVCPPQHSASGTLVLRTSPYSAVAHWPHHRIRIYNTIDIGLEL